MCQCICDVCAFAQSRTMFIDKYCLGLSACPCPSQSALRVQERGAAFKGHI